MASQGSEEVEPPVAEEIKKGLFEYVSKERNNIKSLWFFKRGKPVVEAGNFTVEVVGNYEGSDEVGRIFKVTQQWPKLNTWEAALSFSTQCDGDESFKGLNNKQCLKLDNKYKNEFPDYLHSQGVKYEKSLDGKEQKEYFLIKHTGCHQHDGKYYYIFTQRNSNELLVINEEGRTIEDFPVFLKMDKLIDKSEYGLVNEPPDDDNILMELIQDLLEPSVNRAVTIFAIGWIFSALHGAADEGYNMILLNFFGDASAGKTTQMKILSGMVGSVNLLRRYSPTMLSKQCQYTTLPIICNDPPPTERWMAELHDVAAQIADKLGRKVNNAISNPVGPAGVVSNFPFKKWKYEKHQSIISRSINLRAEAPSNEMKRKFGAKMNKWVKYFASNTCIKEMIKLRHHYKIVETNKYTEFQEIIEEQFKPMFTDCVSRSKDETYPVVLEYAMMALDFASEMEKLDCVWPYLESVVFMHRSETVCDVLERVAASLRLHWDEISHAKNMHDAVRRSAYFARQMPVVMLSITRIQMAYPELTLSLAKLLEKETLQQWKTKYHFIKDGMNSNLRRNKSNAHMFTSIACFKIPVDEVSSEFAELLNEAWEDGDDASQSRTYSDIDGSPEASGDDNDHNETVFSVGVKTPVTPLRNLALSKKRDNGAAAVGRKSRQNQTQNARANSISEVSANPRVLRSRMTKEHNSHS